MSEQVGTFTKRYRRHRLLRAMGHTPSAPNCMFSEPWDHIAGKATCKTCLKINRKWFS